MIMNTELATIWRDVMKVCFQVLALFLEILRKPTKDLIQDSRPPEGTF
jgi:hypothetical protein